MTNVESDVKCAVLGQPIAHSLSPALHNAAYAELGLDWTYAAIEIGEAQLAPFLEGLDDQWRGLSLTSPLKRTVVPLVESLDEWALLTGAANTVVLDAGTRRGYNTDLPGAMAAIREASDGEVESAVVLGGGATAASILIALTQLGCRTVRLLVRDTTRAEATLAAVRGVPNAPEIQIGSLSEPIDSPDILVSTIPVSAQTPELVETVAAPVVFDIVYDPWPTPLAAWARDRVVVSGLDLLAHQAALQIELMTGRSISVALLRRTGEAALAARA